MSIQIPREAVRYDVHEEGGRKFTLLELKKAPDGQPRWWTMDELGRGEFFPLKPAKLLRLPGIGLPSAGKRTASDQQQSGRSGTRALVFFLGLAAAGYAYYYLHTADSAAGRNALQSSPDSGASGPFHLKNTAPVEGTTGEQLTYPIRIEPVPDSMELSGLPPGLEWREKSRILTGKPARAGEFAVKIKARQGPFTGELTVRLRIKPGPSGKDPAPGPPRLFPAEWTVAAGRPFAVEIKGPEAAEFSTVDALPSGISLNGRTLSGTLQEPGRHEIKVTARNSSGEDTTTITIISQPFPVITPLKPIPTLVYADRPLEIRIRVPDNIKGVKWDGELPDGVVFRKMKSSEWALKGVPRQEGEYAGAFRAYLDTGGGIAEADEISLPVSFNVERASLAKQWWAATCDRNSDLEADLVSYPFSLAYTGEAPEVFDSRSDFLKMIYNRDFTTTEIKMIQFTEQGQNGTVKLKRISPVRTIVANIKYRFKSGGGRLISRMELEAADTSYYAPAFTKANVESFLRAWLAAGSWSGSSLDDPAERQSAFFSPSRTVRYFNEDYSVGPQSGQSLKEKLKLDYERDVLLRKAWTWQPEKIQIETTGDTAVVTYNLNALSGASPRHEITVKATAERLAIVSAGVAREQ